MASATWAVLPEVPRDEGMRQMTTPELINDLHSRMDAFYRGDPAGVLDEQALVNADALWAAEHDGESVPLAVVSILAWLHWYRYQALPDGQDPDDFYMAARMFDVIAGTQYEVPEPMLQYLKLRSGDGPGGQMDAVAAGIWLQRAAYRVMHLDEAMTSQQVLDRLPAGPFPPHDNQPDLATGLSNLGAALRLRFSRTHVHEDLDASVSVMRLAVQWAREGDPRRAGILSNLGVILEARFSHAGLADDIND